MITAPAQSASSSLLPSPALSMKSVICLAPVRSTDISFGGSPLRTVPESAIFLPSSHTSKLTDPTPFFLPSSTPTIDRNRIASPLRSIVTSLMAIDPIPCGYTTPLRLSGLLRTDLPARARSQLEPILFRSRLSTQRPLGGGSDARKASPSWRYDDDTDREVVSNAAAVKTATAKMNGVRSGSRRSIETFIELSPFRRSEERRV